PHFADAMSPSQAFGNYGNEEVKKFSAKIAEADAFIIVTPEYNHGYSGTLKNALDSIFPEWNRKPVGFVGYGGVGGARAIEQLRQVVVELEMAPIRSAVHISWDMYMAVVKEKAPTDPKLFKPIEERTQEMLAQLLWWAKALKAARETVTI
ncbi:MAG: NADPH-dependent FMN reductase, partial [Patescibacteria group bacterium]